MKINIKTKELFTDDDKLIKVLDCPLNKSWHELKKGRLNSQVRKCHECKNNVYDTSFFSDIGIVNLVKSKPHACLKVSPFQKNIQIIK